MNIIVRPHMTVEEFLRWSVEQERGRYELEGGRIVAMQAENLRHVTAKRRAFEALDAAIRRSGAACYAMPDGPTVRIASDRAYEPDALVAPLPMPPLQSLEIPNPIIVLEVLSPSPSSIRRDLTTKLAGYALVASIEHYLVIDAEERLLLHFKRQGSVLALVSEASDGTVHLDPPGLALAVGDVLPVG